MDGSLPCGVVECVDSLVEVVGVEELSFTSLHWTEAEVHIMGGIEFVNIA